MNHVHHWRIAEPNGPKSLGVCKLCGVTRDALIREVKQKSWAEEHAKLHDYRSFCWFTREGKTLRCGWCLAKAPK